MWKHAPNRPKEKSLQAKNNLMCAYVQGSLSKANRPFHLLCSVYGQSLVKVPGDAEVRAESLAGLAALPDLLCFKMFRGVWLGIRAPMPE